MGRDDAATVQTLSEHRAIVRACVDHHGGRINDAKGDAILAEFPSSVNAVSCAIEIQRKLLERNASLREDRRMHLRIGVNLGDVIVKDETIYGDGVNIAARLEALAEPGGICISRIVYDSVRNRVQLTGEWLGKKAMKNIAEPIEVFRIPRADTTLRRSARSRRVALGAVAIAVAMAAAAFLAVWPQRLAPPAPGRHPASATQEPEGQSIAVLPFVNMSGRQDEDWFSDGMTETLITDLSRIGPLFVIARNSSFTYKGKPVDVRQVGRELGVRYVLEGSVQRTGDRLRVTAQLVDSNNGRHLWAERYDRRLADVFDVQDDITQKIVAELDVQLLGGEQARTWRKSTRNRQAYELYLRARQYQDRGTREDISRMQDLSQQALDLDPAFTLAMVWLGWTHVLQADAGWSPDWRESVRKAIALARRAIAIDPRLGDAYAGLSHWLSAIGDHGEAVAAAERAIALGPNQADTLQLAGWILALNGRAVEAIPLIQRALRLNPRPPAWYHGGLGDSLLFAGRLDEAVAEHRKCVEEMPGLTWCRLPLAASYALVGNKEAAAEQVAYISKISPDITAEGNTWAASIGIPRDRDRMIEALRRAGLP